jgi:hypothetical protein
MQLHANQTTTGLASELNMTLAHIVTSCVQKVSQDVWRVYYTTALLVSMQLHQLHAADNHGCRIPPAPC